MRPAAANNVSDVKAAPLTVRQQAFLRRYPALTDVQRTFCPRNWGYTVRRQQQAMTAPCVTLGDLDRLYGEDASTDWLATQIMGLFMMSNSREKGTVDIADVGMPLLAGVMRPYTLSELMVFFAGYASGAYGANDWHNFDYRRIGAAFFTEFLPRRQRVLAVIHEQRERQAEAERQDADRQHAISYEEYRRLKEQESGLVSP